MLTNENKELLQLFNDKDRVLNDVKFELELEQNGKVNLEFVEVKTDTQVDSFGEYKRYQYIYRWEEQVDFSFILHCYGQQFVHAFIDVVVNSEKLFTQNDSLSAKNSVVITIKDMGDIEGLFASYRHKDWWTRPHFNKDVTTLPARTQSLLWKNQHSYHYILPVVGPEFKTDLEGAEEGVQLKVSSYDSGRNQGYTPIFILAHGDNPFALARETSQRLLDVSSNTRLRYQKRYPERLDYLGWCSWDAFYHKVNEEGILNKVSEFKEKEIPVKWLMIDDGWSQTAEERLNGFEPDAQKFPSGFKQLTMELKNSFGIDSIGVWHTLAGYWGGIHPKSKLANEMSPNLYKTNSQKLIPYPEKGKGFGFWDAWHSYLKEQGIDFVKVDGQSAINNFMEGQMSIGESSVETHKALEASVGIHFDHCMINCMGMASENIWNRPISSVSRSSDDFVPEDEHGFVEHALQNVYNSYYHGEIYWGDWDMFWTEHKDAGRHALLRALSGGPVYVSDRVGQTNPEVLWPLIMKDGSILRCDQPGRPTTDMLMVNPVEEKKPLKVWNTSNGIGLVGVFNVSQEQVVGNIGPRDIDGFDSNDYLVYDYFNQTVKELGKDERFEVTLEKDSYSFYLIIPKAHVITPLGILDKYVAPATFVVELTSSEKVVVKVKEAGVFGFVTESEVKVVKVNGKEVIVDRLTDNGPIYTIDCSSFVNESMIVEIQV